MPSGLAFYKDDLNPEVYISFDDNEATNPFRITMDGVLGGTIVKKVYLHNDNPKHYYTSITVSIYDSTSGNDYTTGDWRWKLISSEREPVPEEWDQVANLNTISISDIGTSSKANTSDFIPVWIQCTVPAGMLAANITDVYLRKTAQLGLVSDG